MTNIIGISGRKNSGKTTLSSFLHAHQLMSHNIIRNFEVTDDGRLFVEIVFSDENGREKVMKGPVHTESFDEAFFEWACLYMWPFVKAYPFSQQLKLFVGSLFEIPQELMFGTYEQKNTPTEILKASLQKNAKGKIKFSSTGDNATIRDLLQYFGEYFREIDPNIWTNKVKNSISAESTMLAIIPDVRYLNEVEMIKSLGGRIIRLEKLDEDGDKSTSETELNDYAGFDLTIDNQNLAKEETYQRVIAEMDSWGWLSERVVPEKESSNKRNFIKKLR